MTNSKRPQGSAPSSPRAGTKGQPSLTPPAFDPRLQPPEEGAWAKLAERLALPAGLFAVVFFLVATGIAIHAGIQASRTGGEQLPRHEEKASAEDPGSPVAIADFTQADGVTVIAKQVDDAAAPLGAGSQIAEGWSIELGAAKSFSELSRRFADVSQLNQEIPFERLEPRATLKDTRFGLEARLMVGPFASDDDARRACASLALPAGIECRSAPFEGELISRE